MADLKERSELTAYILGELTGEETTILEIEFKKDAELRAESEEIRSFSDLISRELQEAESYSLSSEQRRLILDAVPEELSREPDLWERLEFLAVFAGLLGISLALPHLLRVPDEARERLGRVGEWVDRVSRVLDPYSPKYFRAAVIAACVAVGIYAWARIRIYRARAMPSWCWAAVVFVFLLILAVLMRS